MNRKLTTPYYFAFADDDVELTEEELMQLWYDGKGRYSVNGRTVARKERKVLSEASE